MSLRYSILGIPKTYDELLDKARKKKLKINFTLEEKKDKHEIYHCSVNAQVTGEKQKFSLTDFRGSASRYTKGIKQDAIEKAVKLAENLEHSGLEATVNGETTGKFLEENHPYYLITRQLTQQHIDWLRNTYEEIFGKSYYNLRLKEVVDDLHVNGDLHLRLGATIVFEGATTRLPSKLCISLNNHDRTIKVFFFANDSEFYGGRYEAFLGHIDALGRIFSERATKYLEEQKICWPAKA